MCLTGTGGGPGLVARDHDLTDRGLVTQTGQVRHLDLNGDPRTGPNRIPVGLAEHDLVFGVVGPTDDTVCAEIDQLHLEIGVGVGPVDRELELVGVARIQSRRWLDRELGHVRVLLDCVTGQTEIGYGAVDRVIRPPVGCRIGLKVSLKRATTPVDGSSGATGPSVGTGAVW